MARRRNQRLIGQAALESLVRFGPQLDALDELQQTASGTYKSTVHAAATSAQATKSAVRQARAPLGKVYDDAGLTQANLNAAVGAPHQQESQGLVGLDASPTASLLRQLGVNEATMAATHLNESKVAALQELTNRGLQAEAGRASAVLQAGAQLHSDLAQIGRSRQSIADQSGAFSAATLGGLLETRAGRTFTARQKGLDREAQKAMNDADNATSTANTQARIDAQAAKSGRGLLPNGVKRATPQQHGAVRDKVDAAIAEIAPYKESKKVTRHKLEQLFLVGAPAGVSTTEKNPDGTPKKLAAIPKVAPLALAVALDVLYDGRVSARNRKLLNARGLTVKGVGFKGPMTAAERKRAASAVAKQLRENRGKTGQAVPLL